jgi:hypothetical protein
LANDPATAGFHLTQGEQWSIAAYPIARTLCDPQDIPLQIAR